MLLARPDDRTLLALKRLQADADFQEVTAWLDHSTHELDRANRLTTDAVTLRQQQGAAQVLAEFVERSRGQYKAKAIDRSTPQQVG